MLFWGPLSDKYGRKAILRTGLFIYCFASAGCALSDNITQLIVFRAVQAIGGSGAVSVSMAIVKDMYIGRKRETVLATVQAMVILAPVVAPIIGALLLKITSWRGAFWTLTGVGIVTLFISFLLEETADKQSPGNIFKVVGRLFVVLKNPGFSLLLLTFSMASIPMMAFVASSSYIYVDTFGLSEQTYSYFFAINAISALIGPILYIRLSRHVERRSIIIACFTSITISGVLILGFCHISPWTLAACLIPATMSTSLIRPPSANLMLEQQESDTGSALLISRRSFVKHPAD